MSRRCGLQTVLRRCFVERDVLALHCCCRSMADLPVSPSCLLGSALRVWLGGPTRLVIHLFRSFCRGALGSFLLAGKTPRGSLLDIYVLLFYKSSSCWDSLLCNRKVFVTLSLEGQSNLRPSELHAPVQ